MRITFRPRAALPPDHDPDLCRTECAFESVPGACSADTCHVKELVGGTPAKSRARAVARAPVINTRDIYAARARRGR
jgi:hypothetical protein